MTTSPTTTNSNVEKNDHISRGELAYVAARNQHTAHNTLLRAIKECGKSQKELSRLTGIDEATISRILRRPSNFQINTYSKLLYAACGAFVSIVPIYPQAQRAQVVQAIRVLEKHGNDTRRLVYRVENASEPYFTSASTANKPKGEVPTKTNDVRVLEKQYA